MERYALIILDELSEDEYILEDDDDKKAAFKCYLILSWEEIDEQHT